MTRSSRVQSIDRAMAILNCFSEKNQELKLSEIAERLDLNKSTVHGILNTLKYHGIIDQVEETQRYKLGLYLVELGHIVLKSMDIRRIASPIIHSIRDEMEETVHLGSLDNMEVVYIDKIESHQSMRIFTTIGARKPAYCTGIGKAMLAYLDDEILLNLLPEKLEPLTSKTITDRSKLLEDLAKIREKGYAFDDEENNVGLTCVAAPIFDHRGKARYAISVSGPTVRMNDEKIEEIVRVVKDAAQEISMRLGYRQ